MSLASTLGKPWPTLKVFGEGLMGSGGLVRGATIENPTFGELVRRLKYVPPTVALDPEDAEARNLAGVENVKKAPIIRGVDDAESLRNPKRRTD